jgi:hypothetical protein
MPRILQSDDILMTDKLFVLAFSFCVCSSGHCRPLLTIGRENKSERERRWSCVKSRVQARGLAADCTLSKAVSTEQPEAGHAEGQKSDVIADVSAVHAVQHPERDCERGP